MDLNSTFDLPIAIIILPQLGSSPAIAVLTKVNLQLKMHIFFASSSVLQFLTFTVINLEAPSPSAATLFARFKRTLNKAELKFLVFYLLLFKFEFKTSPVAKIETISFVLVSPSQVIALNVFLYFF